MKILTLLAILAAQVSVKPGQPIIGAPGQKPPANTGVIVSQYAKSDFELTADPNSRQWKGIAGVFAENDAFGKPVPGHRTEIRSRWSDRNLYLLYVCPYEQLFLHPDPSTTTETNKLWEWDVAEAFIGSDYQNIYQYKEFQVSPQGEWVDLDIDRKNPKPEGGWRWNSGFKVKARVDPKAKTWYGEMQIPLSAIDPRPARDGQEMRINLYRCQDRPPDRKFIAWQPTHNRSFHTPEAFGTLRLKK